MSETIPTDRELEALKVLWAHGKATVRVIHEAMNADDAGLAYTTVLSLLQTMEQKGLVRHERTGKSYTYFANAERERTFRRLATGFLEKVFDGAIEEYIVHALQSPRVSREELDRVEEMLRRAKDRLRRAEKTGK